MFKPYGLAEQLGPVLLVEFRRVGVEVTLYQGAPLLKLAQQVVVRDGVRRYKFFSSPSRLWNSLEICAIADIFTIASVCIV